MIFRSPPGARAALALAAFVLVLPAGAQEGRDFLPGAVLRGGWPAGRTGGVEELCALRFSSPLELDALARIGDEAFLVHHPARFADFYPLAGGVGAVAALPGAGGLDVALVGHAAGLSVVSADPAAPGGARTDTVAGSAAWSGVARMWVHESGGTFVVCGHDPAAGLLRRLVHDPAVGPPTQVGAPASWSAGASTVVPIPLLELTQLEYDAAWSGEELACRFDTSFLVTDAAISSTILAGDATPHDQLGSLPGGAAELLLWTTPVLGVTHLYSGNATAMGGAPPLAFPGRVFSGLLAVELMAPSPGDGLELALPEDDGAYVTALERDPSAVTNPFGFVWGMGDTLDTLEPGHPLPTRPGVRAACAGDFDNDGDTDLLVAHEGVLQLRFWLNQEIGDESQRLYNDDVVVVTPLTGGGFNVGTRTLAVTGSPLP